jgi:hypothetical protein
MNLLLAAVLMAAGDVYVPVGSVVSAPSMSTSVRLTNPTEESMPVTIELLKAGSGRMERFVIAAGQSRDWSAAGSDGFGVLKISAGERLQIDAVNHDSGATTTVPLLDGLKTGDIGISSQSGVWKSGIGVINPDAAPLSATISLIRDDAVIDTASVTVPARAVRLFRVDRLFKSVERIDRLASRALMFAYDVNERSGAQIVTPAATVIPRRRHAVQFPSTTPPPPQTVVMTSSKDNTLYFALDGGLSNGAGTHIFSGTTSGQQIRRALLAFDVASQVSPGSHITRASLKLHISQSRAGAQPLELRRVTADWGEGGSFAGTSRDGGGGIAQAGDATWIHRFKPDRVWTNAGGDFASAADATAQGTSDVTWESSATMISRVQSWLDQPSTNFGWLILGNETVQATATRLDSREIETQSTRPTLTIEFTK